ncbi:hypothetical protein G9A89_006924 [Geosiphon pyriformis]|nr:hypothetical protein G9A89_006924 [Geosiphon pyriformis]
MNRAKSKKVANITFSIVTNKVLTREGFSVIEAAKQNVLATFPLKNNSNKLPLTASGSFSSLLAGSSSLVKVLSKKHTRVSPSVVSTISKSPKIFNNRPVNKLVFPALTTLTTTSTTTASQMAAKAKNPKKQQQAVTTAMVTPNPFVVPDEIFSKISTVAASPIPDMDGNSSNTSPKLGQDQPLAVLSDVVLSGRSSPIPVVKQSINPDDLKDWADQIEMESTVPSPVFGASNADAVKLFCVEFASQECLNGATKVAISDEIFLTTLKIAWSLGVASVFFSSLSVALCNIPLGASFDDIKSALGIFGVVTSVKLKPAGLWQYAVVSFKNIFSAAAALSNWSVLVRKDSVRILSIANQKKVISSRDAFKAKLVNLLFGCTAFEISDLVFQVGGLTFGSLESLNAAVLKTSILLTAAFGGKLLDVVTAIDVKVLPPPPPKLSSNSAGGPIIFKSFLIGAKSYAKATTSVVPPVATTADTSLASSTSSRVVVPLLPVASSGSDVAVNAKLASLEIQLSELFLLIKSIIEPVSSLVALVTMLLSIPPVMTEAMKKSVIGLGNQIKAVHAVASVLQKEVGALKLKSGNVHYNIFDDEDMNDDDNDDDDDGDAKNFSVYDDTFDAMMELWKTAKWMSSLVKSSHELVCIMGKIFELIENIPDHAFDSVMTEITNEEFKHILSHTPYNKALKHNAYIKAANMPKEWRVAQVILIPKPKKWDGNIDITRLITLIESTRKILTKILIARILKTCKLYNVLKSYNILVLKNTSTAVPIYVINIVAKHTREFEIIDSKYQVEGSITSTTEKEDISTNLQNSSTVETARPSTPLFRFETTNRLIGSVNTSSGDDMPFRIANTLKKTALYKKVADFSPITANRLEKKANKKYRHIGRISVKELTEKFNQITEENSPETTSVQINNFVLQPMFNKCENSNKFQMEAWTSEKGASKSLKKIDKPSKVPKKNRKRAAQIEAALRKCNPDILDRINRGNSVIENEKQMNNPFNTNRNKPNIDDVTEDIKDSELSLSSRMASPSSGQ